MLPLPSRSHGAPEPAASASFDAAGGPVPPRISAREADGIVLPGGDAPTCDAVFVTADSDAHDDSDARHIRCLLEARFAGDDEARRIALSLYARSGTVVGVERAHTMDGGYRGAIAITPAVPVGVERVHLAWVSNALLGFETFFEALGRASANAADGGKPARAYRFEPLAVRFARSVHRRTPSAYAVDWTVTYNVAGSLNTSAEAVRELLFHEIFHLNDQAGDDWSSRALAPTFDAIVARCGARTSCLAPFAPNNTMVRGGTYYAFQPGNDVREYAAELALRYYREQSAALGLPEGPRRALVSPFKCKTPENARAWGALVREVFGGRDVTAPCP